MNSDVGRLPSWPFFEVNKLMTHDLRRWMTLCEAETMKWSTPPAPKALQAKYDALDWERNPDLSGKIMDVPLNQITRVQSDVIYPENVLSLQNQYKTDPSEVPEPILLKHGSFYAAVDGDHRIEAKIRNGDKTIRAIVLPSSLKYELRRR